jgi:hypothetical protein
MGGGEVCPFHSFYSLVWLCLKWRPMRPSLTHSLSLHEVSQRYADVNSYYIEAIEEETSGNELGLFLSSGLAHSASGPILPR